MAQNKNIAGNYYDKYGTRNPVAQYLVRNFLDTLSSCYNDSNPSSVLDVGCGEGILIQHLVKNALTPPDRVTACDISINQVADGLDPLIQFLPASIYELPFDNDEYDFVSCCEVMEHLEFPEKGLGELARVARQWVLISVPREPIWRIMNILRLRYLGSLGNTPGHIQHFSRNDIIRLVSKQFGIVSVTTPLPWTVILCKPK